MTTTSTTHLNGKAVTAEQLAPLAFAGYAHFTAMQVRGGAVRGLSLHLDRLRTASEEMFGQHLPDDSIRDRLSAAVAAGGDDSSLTCFVTTRSGEFTPPDPDVELDVLVRVSDAAVPPRGPLRLDAVNHERHLAHVKHVGEVAKTLYLHRARIRGFDDAAFIDSQGRLSEGTIWNLAFWDGDSIIWPRADVLPGVTMRVLARRLDAQGIPQQTRDIGYADLTGQLSAVVMNSWTPGVSVACIGDQPMGEDPSLVGMLHDVYATETPEPV